MKMKVLIAGAILQVYCSVVFGLNPSLDVSQYAHKSWKVREGFFNGSINAVVRTPDGYVWLGTDVGLYRFDGVRSVRWQSRGNESLPSNIIRRLFVSRDGTLWIGTQKGLASLKSGKLNLYPEFPTKAVDAIAEDGEGTIWAGLEEVPAWRLCAIKNGSVRCEDKGALGLGKGSLLSDQKGNLWAGTGTGLWRFKLGSPESIPLSGPASETHAVIEGDHGDLLVSTRGGIISVVGTKSAAYRLPDYGQPFNPFSLLRDRDGGLWIGTKDRGLLHVHQGRTDHFGKSDGLSSDSIADLFEGNEGNIWVATASGLDQFREFAVYSVSDSPGFSSASVESVLAASDGGIWLGTRDGLDRWQDGHWTLYRQRRAHFPPTTHQIIDPGLPDDFQSTLYQDQRGRIWVFSRGGAAHLDERGGFIRVPGLPGGYAHAIAEDRAGDLWMSQDQGFFHLLPQGKVAQIPWSKLGGRGVALALAGDPSGAGLWLGFSQGGVAYFKDGQISQWYTAADGLGEGRVTQLQVDPDGSIWAATEGGLSHFKNDGIKTLSTRNGLPCSSVYEFVRHNAQSMWLHTSCGLLRIADSDLEAWIRDPDSTVKPTVFDTNDGLTPIAMPGGLSPRMGKSRDERIWLVSGDGLSVIDPRHLPLNAILPPVYIEQIIADGKNYEATNGLRLPPGVRNLAFDFIALSLVVPEKNRYRFKLDGWDREWREAVNELRVEYSNLPPRHYKFRVVACNNSGIWNEEGAALDFVIPPAYWQTNWFRVMCVAAVIGLLWLMYHWRMRTMERHQTEITALNDRLMKAQEEERTRIAGELHDGVLQQLTSVTLLLGAVKYEIPQESEATSEIEKLQKRLMQVGTDIRQLSHELHPASLQDQGLPDALSVYCDEFSKARGIPVMCQTDATAKELSRGAALVLYRIAQEALGNVAKHAQAKHVQVRLTRENGRVRLTVADDGVGFALDGAGKAGGLGLVNMRERLRQLNGTLELQSEPGRGTTVTAEVPFRPAS